MDQRFAFLFLFCSIVGHVASFRSGTCGGEMFVEKSAVIDAPTDADCTWKIETEPDRILALSAVNIGSFEQVQEYFTIHDGLGLASPIIYANEGETVVYTTQSSAEIRFKKMPTTQLQLKIQKAVNCPADLGLETNCTRLVDDVSCHCASYTKRNQTDQKAFCEDNGMLLVSIETPEEDKAISDTWGLGSDFWTSCIKTFGRWVWEATNTNLYPGYVNWYPIAEPFCNDQYDKNYTCMLIGYNGLHWGSYHCDGVWGAVCELHP
ncbi:Uncharacterized protein APZ42_030656 [Daphnia magna]|uniref:C-type lectin domain-containing protein n=1 Tax=Daphnia magna TaxID=35525 RepID=A0A164NQD8_9CRUS|nr:Uncharacterized protein APZ42_030656 [Daphnia magna]